MQMPSRIKFKNTSQFIISNFSNMFPHIFVILCFIFCGQHCDSLARDIGLRWEQMAWNRSRGVKRFVPLASVGDQTIDLVCKEWGYIRGSLLLPEAKMVDYVDLQ